MTWAPTPLTRASLWLHKAAIPVLALAPEAWLWVLGGLAANHLLLAVGMHPRSQIAGPSLVRLPGPGVALTFDDGPDPALTPRVLDVLDAHGARASFFCIGARASAHPALVREIVRRGHRVENHTWSHPYGFAAYTPGPMRREVLRAQAVLSDIAGVPPVWFRAPMGLRSPALDPILACARLRHAAWTRRAYDWSCRDPAVVARRLTAGLAPGDVLLLHDGNSARDGRGLPVVLGALPAILAAITALGERAIALPAAARPATADAAACPPSAARASK